MKIKEIKSQAKLGLKGNFFKAIFITLFYTVLTILIEFSAEKLSLFLLHSKQTIITLLINLTLLPFSYGVLSSLINIFKGKKVAYTEFINISLLNYSKIIKLFLSLFLRILPFMFIVATFLVLINTNFNNIIINYIALILSFITLVILLIKILDYIFVLFINYDNPKLSCKEIISKSKSIIKNNKFKYLLLILSFILWFIIIVLINRLLMYFISDITIISYINSIMIAFITPMITISQYIFYDNLINENK